MATQAEMRQYLIDRQLPVTPGNISRVAALMASDQIAANGKLDQQTRMDAASNVDRALEQFSQRTGMSQRGGSATPRPGAGGTGNPRSDVQPTVTVRQPTSDSPQQGAPSPSRGDANPRSQGASPAAQPWNPNTGAGADWPTPAQMAAQRNAPQAEAPTPNAAPADPQQPGAVSRAAGSVADTLNSGLTGAGDVARVLNQNTPPGLLDNVWANVERTFTTPAPTTQRSSITPEAPPVGAVGESVGAQRGGEGGGRSPVDAAIARTTGPDPDATTEREEAAARQFDNEQAERVLAGEAAAAQAYDAQQQQLNADATQQSAADERRTPVASDRRMPPPPPPPDVTELDMMDPMTLAVMGGGAAALSGLGAAGRYLMQPNGGGYPSAAARYFGGPNPVTLNSPTPPTTAGNVTLSSGGRTAMVGPSMAPPLTTPTLPGPSVQPAPTSLVMSGTPPGVVPPSRPPGLNMPSATPTAPVTPAPGLNMPVRQPPIIGQVSTPDMAVEASIMRRNGMSSITDPNSSIRSGVTLYPGPAASGAVVPPASPVNPTGDRGGAGTVRRSSPQINMVQQSRSGGNTPAITPPQFGGGRGRAKGIGEMLWEYVNRNGAMR